MSVLIDSWRSIKKDSKKEELDQFLSLIESEQIETELTDNSVSESENITNTKHYLLHGDINSDLIKQSVESISKIDLIFTSPPYNANINYDSYDDNKKTDDYLNFLKQSIDSCDIFLKPGGRFVINIRDIKIEKGRLPIISFLYPYFLSKGYFYRGLHIWYKGREESSFAWGTYKSSSNPSIIDLFEYVFVFQKSGIKEKGVDNISKHEFIENVMGLWKIRPVKKINNKKVNILNHPCPFPVELAKRVIKLYSNVNDFVLDPFSGICNTSIASYKTGRNSISTELSNSYCLSGLDNFKNQCNLEMNYKC